MNILLISDDFTTTALTEACERVTHLTPDSYRVEVPRSNADFLFVESAWQGLDNTWHRKLSPPSLEILECVSLCKEFNIPTVFWNKEDPVHFGTFLPLVRYFDHVFTTDIDCIPRYKKALGHDRVSLLPFAVQPTVHNPISSMARKNAFCFAGSWYQRYPERQREFNSLVQAISDIGRLDIYDRNYNNNKADTKFPTEYTHLIKGFLPFDQIDVAYKGYRFALNINTVTQSQSMFARRVYELMCSNSIVVSNPSKGLNLFFGDLVISDPDKAELKNKISSAWRDETSYRKQRLMALRSVLKEHTYEHRLQYIKSRINGERWQPAQSEVLVFTVVRTLDSECAAIENIKRQQHPCRSLILRVYESDDTRTTEPHASRISIYTNKSDFITAFQTAITKHSWLTYFSSDDYYGPNYLTDLSLATQFIQADTIGKKTHFSAEKDTCILNEDGEQYSLVDKLLARSSIMLSSKLPAGWLEEQIDDLDGATVDWSISSLATDEFQYCRNGYHLSLSQVTEFTGDIPLNTGLSLAEDILPIAERLTAADYCDPSVSIKAVQITGDVLYSWLKTRLPEKIELELQGDSLILTSHLDDDATATLYAAQRFSRSELNLLSNNQIRLILQHDLPEIKTVFEFENASRVGIGHSINSAGAAYSFIIPDECHYIRIALQLKGSGTANIQNLVLGKTTDPSAVSIEKCTTPLKPLKQKHAKTFLRSGASKMSLTNRAQAAFNAGQYALAIELYTCAILEQPELARLYQFNLNIAHKKLGTSKNTAHEAESVSTSPHQTPPGNNADLSFIPLEEIYRRIAEASPNSLPLSGSPTPLVSVLMTTSNDAELIEEAVSSVLRQSWENLELIIVDDFSSDDTWPILQRLQRTVGNLFCHRLNTCLGKGFARNLAIQKSHGNYLFFQSGNELSHPERIRLSMHHLLKTEVAAVVENRLDILIPSNQVVRSELPPPSPAPTLALKRLVFERTGYLDYYENSLQSEFNSRLHAWIATEGYSITEMEHSLVYNTSIGDKIPLTAPFSDAGYSPDNGLTHNAVYHEAFTHLHQQLGIERLSEFFRFPVIRDLIPVPPALSSLANPTQPVVVSLCSIPERAELLRQVLASLAPQVDALHIYLDRYDSIPDFVRNCHPQVTVYLSKDHPGLRDNGKFLAFSALAEDCYYFTADDDIVYPPDYVASMVRRIEDYERQAVIGVHGVLLPEQADGYFTSFRKVHMFKKELERDALVNNLGTGTVAFHSGLLRGLDLTHFGTPGMADLHLSVFCKQRDIPMIALARPEDWLQELPSPNTSLYNEFRQADDQQSALIRAHKPWGYAAISKAVAGASMRATKPDTGERLQRLIPLLHACLK
ncbi:glycosyltransferase [Pseudomonas sp. NPDC008258]|uniref:glycosyltransferase n=1 Tax=Pseudomonas sp. NPDC008258 TaxID=3364418 RepID=UPI0036E76592